MKPLFGLRPGVYIAIAGSLVLALILFLALFYPGMVRPGAMVVFTSEPAGAAVRVDDVYAGSSPCRVFVPKGEHILETVLPGFQPNRQECSIPGRLFASAFIPRRYNVHVTLSTANPMEALALSARDYASWTFGGEPASVWQVPLSLSEGVYRIGSAAAGTDAREILAAAARFAATRASVRDLVRAQTLAVNGGLAPSPLTITQTVGQIAAFLDEQPNGAAWLADTLSPEAVTHLIASAWYQNQLAAFAEVTAREVLSLAPEEPQNPETAAPFSQIRVGGLLFTGIGGGILARGEPFPHEAPVDAFMICATEVPAPAYADFLDANPGWRAEQRDSLKERGLVTGDYLADYGTVPDDGRSGAGISAVSWFAARAFCEWLSGQLPESLADWEVRLPTETEWEYAAKSSQTWNGYQSVFAPDGGMWEWCLDPYVPLPFLSVPPRAQDLLGSPERSLRGGSWLHTTGTISNETRGSLPAAACSPFVSFRPVIARRNGMSPSTGR